MLSSSEMVRLDAMGVHRRVASLAPRFDCVSCSEPASGQARSEALEVPFAASASMSEAPDYGSAVCSKWSVVYDYDSAARRNWSARSSSGSAVIQHRPAPSSAPPAVSRSAPDVGQKQFASIDSPV